MLLPRLQPPLRAAIAAAARHANTATTTTTASQTTLIERFANLNLARNGLGALTFVRHASHNAQGTANGVKDRPGRRLGAKKTGEEYVIPGNIIFRQRGTKWYPGENCAMGRDHTIYATSPGYVKYYKDPARHPDRRYIGVVFKRDDVLPLPPHTPRRRRLGMVAVPIPSESEPTTTSLPEDSTQPTPVPDGMHFKTTDQQGLVYDVKLRQGYMYREANWEIGRVAERAGVKVREYKRGDRWLAWRKRAAAQKAASAKKKLAKRSGGGAAKKRGK